MCVTNFYEIYLFMASYIVSWNHNAFYHWPIGVIVVFIIQLHKVEYKNARIEYKYPPILYGYSESWLWIAGYLDSWLFCTVKRPCLTSRLSALRFSIRFAFLALWEMSKETWQKKAFGEWITYIISICLTLLARQNTAQLVKILSDTTH